MTLSRQRNDAPASPAPAAVRPPGPSSRVSEAELGRLQVQVRSGEPLAADTEAGRRLTTAEVQNRDSVQERNRAQAGIALARWRRANDILRASNLPLPATPDVEPIPSFRLTAIAPPKPEARVQTELEPFLDPEPPPPSRPDPEAPSDPLRVDGDDEPFAENAELGFPPQDPNGESHPELRANLHWLPLPDSAAESAGGPLSRLLQWMR